MQPTAAHGEGQGDQLLTTPPVSSSGMAHSAEQYGARTARVRAKPELWLNAPSLRGLCIYLNVLLSKWGQGMQWLT